MTNDETEVRIAALFNRMTDIKRTIAASPQAQAELKAEHTRLYEEVLQLLRTVIAADVAAEKGRQADAKELRDCVDRLRYLANAQRNYDIASADVLKVLNALAAAERERDKAIVKADYLLELLTDAVCQGARHLPNGRLDDGAIGTWERILPELVEMGVLEGNERDGYDWIKK